MKEVAEGLRKSGNYGTAHVYRSSMNAIIAFNGSRNLPFKKVNQEFLNPHCRNKPFTALNNQKSSLKRVRFPCI